MDDIKNVVRIEKTRVIKDYSVGIYARVSTNSKEQLDSLANQISGLTRLAAAHRTWFVADMKYVYEHGTHFAFPESMLKMMLPVGSKLLVSLMFKAGKQYPEECRQTRIDIDHRLKAALKAW